MLRYIKRLERKDLSLAHVDDPARLVHDEAQRHGRDDAGHLAASSPTCTPSRPPTRPPATGELFGDLEGWLAEITGFAAVSLQPNAGSQGEYAGLLVIRAYHEARGEGHRDVCLIPVSAHGTNPACAVMAGMKVVVVACDEQRQHRPRRPAAKAAANAARLAALMVTYPSTHGVFEEEIREICAIVHRRGRPGLHGRRQHERPGRPLPARRHRRRRLPPEPAQDLLHPARRRRPGHGADRRRGAPGALPARPPAGRLRRRAARSGRCRRRRGAAR